MKLARVIGVVTSAARHAALHGVKLLMVQPLNDRLEPHGRASLAVDSAGAGVGDCVLLVEEGTAASRLLGSSDAPVRTVIIGIVDRVDVLAQEDIAGRV